MLAKLEECSLLKKKDNLGNAALKQGKKFNKYSGIVKSNRKVSNKSNKVKNEYSLNGYLIEGFNAQDIDDALHDIKLIESNISNKSIPTYTKRYTDETNFKNYDDDVQNLQQATNVKLSSDNTGRTNPSEYRDFTTSISNKTNELKNKIGKSKLKMRNFNEDKLFDIIEKKKQEYNQLKSTEVLNGQLNNTQLTNKSYYLQYIIWLVAAISMGGLVLKKVFNN